MRREAAAALLLEDARPLPPVNIAASTGRYREISRDGRGVLAAFIRPQETITEPLKAGLRLFDLSDGRQVAELLNPTLTYLPKALSPDGTFLAVAGADPSRGIQLLNLPEGTLCATLPMLPGPAPALPATSSFNPLVFSPDGRYLAAVRTDSKKSDLFVWDLRDPSTSRHLTRVDASVASMRFRSDGQVLAYPAGGNKLGIVDVGTRGEPKIIDLPLPIGIGTPANLLWHQDEKIAWSPTSAVLAVACTNPTGQTSIVFWDTNRQVEQARWDGNFDMKSLAIAYSTDGKRLAACDSDAAIRVFDIAKQREVLRLEDTQPGGASLLHWLADGRLLTADFFGNSFTTWEPSEGFCRRSSCPAKTAFSSWCSVPMADSSGFCAAARSPASR